MENLAKWMGYQVAVNYTKKKAYFKLIKGDQLEFIAHVKDYDPRVSPQHFLYVIDTAIQRGAVITVNKKKVKTSTYINVEAVVEINKQIHSGTGIDFSRAFVNAIRKYVNNLNY